ncbi:MAG: DUF5706 domain-containing protein [Cytophagales bacterium]|nr:DUF5706 domain-containing protein [Cytophagales bacterium]
MSKLIRDVESFAREFFSKSQPLSYHNLEHTQNVVRLCRIIGEDEGISEHEMLLLEIAAWFHDIGYCKSCSEHEERSSGMACEYIQSKLNQEDLKVIQGCIMATQLTEKPQTLLQKIICDADLSHLGSLDYFERAESLRQELIESSGMKISKSDWVKKNIDFLSKHRFYTDYANRILEPVKQKHLEVLKKKPVKLGKPTQKKTVKKNSNKKLETVKPRRDIESMYRIVSRNQMNLSALADRKSNILLTINSAIISFAIGVLFRKFDGNFLYPSILFCLTGLGSIILTVIATRPKVTKGTISREDVLNNKANVLFFGNFNGMSLDEFGWSIDQVTKRPKTIYDNLMRDTYFLGLVLTRKYRFLNWAYNFFMFGLIITVIAFVITFLFFNDGSYTS